MHALTCPRSSSCLGPISQIRSSSTRIKPCLPFAPFPRCLSPFLPATRSDSGSPPSLQNLYHEPPFSLLVSSIATRIYSSFHNIAFPLLNAPMAGHGPVTAIHRCVVRSTSSFLLQRCAFPSPPPRSHRPLRASMWGASFGPISLSLCVQGLSAFI